MYDVEQFRNQARSLRDAHDVVNRIVALASDREHPYGKECEIGLLRIDASHCLKPEVKIAIWLNSERRPFLSVQSDEDRKETNKRARAFVLAVLAEFKTTAERFEDSPENLRARVSEEQDYSLHKSSGGGL